MGQAGPNGPTCRGASEYTNTIKFMLNGKGKLSDLFALRENDHPPHGQCRQRDHCRG
jgi:hypothetical protein